MSRGIEEDVNVFSWMQMLWLWFDVWMSLLSHITIANCESSILFGMLLFDSSSEPGTCIYNANTISENLFVLDLGYSVYPR